MSCDTGPLDGLSREVGRNHYTWVSLEIILHLSFFSLKLKLIDFSEQN